MTNSKYLTPASEMTKPIFPSHAGTEEYAKALDSEDPLRSFREKFIIPSVANVESKKLAKPGVCPLQSHKSTPPLTSAFQVSHLIPASISVVTH